MAVEKVVRTDFFPLVREFVDACNRRDFEALGKFYAQDAVAEGLGMRFEGRDAIIDFMKGMLRAFPDLSVDYRHQFSVGTHGVVEWVMRGTHNGELELPWGSIAATGRRVEWTGVSILEMNSDGLVVRERAYADLAGLLRQLGVLKQFGLHEAIERDDVALAMQEAKVAWAIGCE